MAINEKFINSVYRIAKNGMSLEEFANTLNISKTESIGLIELLTVYDKQIELVPNDEFEFIICKGKYKFDRKKFDKESFNKLTHTEICVVSDTHLGNNHQQLHLLNKIYEEAYERGIKKVLHVGDLVDGDYLAIRKEQGRQVFLKGFDEQAGYVCDMYPKVRGITTEFILGSHDETHYKNGGATLGYWIPKCRKDLVYLGQDTAMVNINDVKICLDHPGGGSAKSLSYKLQARIEELESGQKPKILLVGHYHKSYYFNYRNVHGIEIPALCDRTQFQQKQGLSNALGAYFLDIYSDKNGNIIYFIPEEVLFDRKDVWDEVGKDKGKVKQLVIK